MLSYTYLATPEDLNAFDANNLAGYQYVALIGLGCHAKSVDTNELNLIKVSLAQFMRDDCLIVSAMELVDASERSFIKSVYHIFEPPEKMEAYVAIATVFPGINEKLLLNPAYHELVWDPNSSSRRPVYSALTQCLETLHSKLFYASLADIPLPNLSSKEKSLVCPNGGRIKVMRGKIGSVNKVSEEPALNADGSERVKLARTTLDHAEKYEPVTKRKLEEIARYFKVHPATLTLEQLAPLKGRLVDVRNETSMGKGELAKTMGLPTGFFFDLLEEADVIPAKTMRFIFNRYTKLLKNKPTFASLLDLPKTEALATKTRIN